MYFGELMTAKAVWPELLPVNLQDTLNIYLWKNITIVRESRERCWMSCKTTTVLWAVALLR